jgi:two-component system response regulator YesN
MYRRIPFVSAARIEAMARQLHRAVVSLTAGDGDVDGVFGAAGIEAGVGGSRLGGGTGGRERLLRESRINEYMQELKRYRRDNELQAGIPTYPLETEQALLDAIAAGEGDRAQGILNELLGHVFFTLGADLERIKVRAREIVVLLSRIVIARGADANRVFGFNYRALDELDGLDDINDVAHWMARIVRGFTGSVLRVPVGAAHTTLLRKVIDYIEETYRGRVSLSAAAQIAGVSSAYLSRVFSAEMGETFSRYVRRMRVQRAQDLLTGTRLPISDIAELAGFADQSHLTAAFRAETGTTPAQFRARG